MCIRDRFGSGQQGFHHFMVEYNSLDDVGQGYDLMNLKDDKIAYTMGRHTNDYMPSHCISNFIIF